MKYAHTSLFLASALAVVMACGSSNTDSPGSSTLTDAGADSGSEPKATSIYLAPEAQREGDATKGYHALVNEPYVPCGIPKSAYSQVFGAATADQRVPGREGDNADLPYNFTAFTTKEGVQLVTANCLTCHAGRINGELIVGLGAADGDFSGDPKMQKNTFEGVGLLLSDPKERAEWMKWKERVETIAPYSYLDTRGPNPADEFTSVLFSHHDPLTLAWLSTPSIPLPDPSDLPVDVPPYWRMKKKSSMFYIAGGRGDHSRHMMTASILCISSVDEARAIDAYFGDVEAYIKSIVPPKYPFTIDTNRTDRGREVFSGACARCHGTYGDTPDKITYPNLLITLPEIGTDPLLASGQAYFAKPFLDWHKQSFFGETARLEPQEGYVAPPLDGIWATAPFLHNGSIPTLAALLDSKTRPTYWTRTFDSTDYDQNGVGWNFTALDHGKDGESTAKAKAALYDTTRLGYGNGGHTYGDLLTDDDRTSLLEYLKTL